MVTCRCGCEFENSRWESHVMCPKCKRIYPNSAPDLYHPKSVDELVWKCPECNASNDCSYAGAPRRSCVKCGAKRPGKPEEKKHRCPCCGYYTLDTYLEYDICKVCFWEDDPDQRKDETNDGGANKVSLVEARKNYQEFGACEAAMLRYVRKPNADELTGIDE